MSAPGAGANESEFFLRGPAGGEGEGDADREVERITSGIELEQRAASIRRASSAGGDSVVLPDLLDCSGILQDAANAIVDDSFNKCFQSTNEAPWNWNFYLFPLWCGGLVIRYGILFPVRLVILLLCVAFFLLAFFTVHYCVKGKVRLRMERWLVEFFAASFVVSWTGVIKYHGPRPTYGRAGQVFVSNHTSMIDYIVLTQVAPFAAIMQKHKGWVGFLQSTVMQAIHCIQFNRTDMKDREKVQVGIREHVQDPERLPLLIFPEGTCVNNEYCVMFKRGAFDLGVTVNPIAIKYNKIFVDAFWNSKRQSFTAHLLKLMTSWAVVADVWYMEPQNIRPRETSIEFAERVRAMICEQAGLKPVPWDGMLKYYRPNPRMCEKRRAAFAETLRPHLPSISSREAPSAGGIAGHEAGDDIGLRQRRQT